MMKNRELRAHLKKNKNKGVKVFLFRRECLSTVSLKHRVVFDLINITLPDKIINKR